MAHAIGPLTSHIMWTNQLQFGGVSGGNTFYNGGGDPNISSRRSNIGMVHHTSQDTTNPIVIDGYLYYTEPVSFSGGSITDQQFVLI